MLGINCLVNRPILREELRDLVSEYADLLITMDKSPSVYGVYSALRKDGYELDSQTVGELYRDLFSGQDVYSKDEEIDAFSNKPYIDLFKAEAEANKVKEIGRNSPVVAAVSSLMNGVKLMAETVPSLQKVFEERLLKAAKRVTGYKSERSDASKTSEQILTEVLAIERYNDFGRTPEAQGAFSAMNNAELLWREFKREFQEVADELYAKGDVFNGDKIMEYASILENASYQLMMSAPEIQKVIGDTLKEAGYKKEVKGTTGTREIIDWNKVFADSDFNFRDTFKNVFRPKGFTEAELNRIADELEGEYDKLREAKMAAALEQRNKTRKTNPPKTALQRLNQLYQYGIFNSSQQQAMFKVLGVQPTTAAQISQLNQLMALNNRLLNDPIAKWSDTYIKTIRREIENIIERSEENRDLMLKMIRGFSFFNQINNAMLLSNAQNVTENTLSGLFQYLVTNVFTQPREAVKTFRIAFNTWVDIAKGGAREGSEKSDSFNNSGGTEEGFNFETAKTGGQKVMAAMTLVPRVMLSAMDNAIKAGLIHQISIDMLKKELKNQGLDKDEIELVIAEIFYGNRQQLEEIAKIMQQNLEDSGVNAAKGKWKRMAAQLAWANMVSDGNFFTTAINNLKNSGRLSKDVELNEELLKAIKDAAEEAAAKGLGHQSDSWVMKAFTDYIPSMFSRSIQEARSKGRGLARAELARSAFAQANKFRFGALRWTWLTLEKTTGLALMQTLLTDVLYNKIKKSMGKEYRPWLYTQIDSAIDYDDKNQVKNLQENLAWYASLKQRLIRESIGPIMGYISVQMISAVFSGGGDDEDKKQALIDLAVSMQEDRMKKRWFQKALPPRAFAYLSTLAWTERGEIKTKDIDEVELPDAISPIQAFLGINELYPSVINNLNESTAAKIYQGLTQNNEDGWAKVGDGLINSVITSPLKVLDVQMGPFKKNPLLDSDEYNRLEPKGFEEGALKGILNKGLWNNIKNSKQDDYEGSSIDDLLRSL